MGDLISRQQAIEAVVGCTNCGTEDVLRAYVTKHSLENGWTGGIVDALDAIEQLPSAQPEQRWIPCSERLPDKMGDYLVTLCGNGEPWVEIALWNETFGGRWQMVLYNDVDYSDISNVIAWMPLPKPYQEGEQE